VASEVTAFEAYVNTLMSGKKRNLERRLENMMKQRKARKGMVFLSMIMALLIASSGTVFAFANSYSTLEIDLGARHANTRTEAQLPTAGLDFNHSEGGVDAIQGVSGVTRLEGVTPMAYMDVLDLSDIDALAAMGLEVVRKHVDDLNIQDEFEIDEDTLARSVQSINVNVPAFSAAFSNTLPMGAGQRITVNVSYWPPNAALWVGVMEPDGWISFIRAFNGTFNGSFGVWMNGSHRLVFDNGSAQSVSVSGFVTTGW
jgi:hypothetical protein